jgi:predicted DCC family thiol-disulfide oxidoreductase YuxK
VPDLWPGDAMPSVPQDHPIVLFDGYCNFCSGAVRFILRRDPRGNLRFAPLTSPLAARLLAGQGMAGPLEDTIFLVDGGRVYGRSEAALRIAARLRPPWSLARLLRVVPRGLRDWAYDLFARHRYRWFGRRETCMLPTPEERSRFLSAEGAATPAAMEPPAG